MEALPERDEHFRLLVESVQDYAILMLDRAGRVISWNVGAERVLGYRAEEVTGRHFSLFYPPQAIEAQEPERELEAALAAGSRREEGWRVRKDGSSFWASAVTTVVRDAVGRHRGFSKVVRDITEHKRDDDRLQAVGEVTQAILQGQDTEDVLRLIARRARELVGAALASVLAPEPGGGSLLVRAADGCWAEEVRGARLPATGSPTGDVLRTGDPLSLVDVSTTMQAYGLGTWVEELGPALYVPLAVGGNILGIITVVNRKGDRLFTEADTRVVQLFAAPVGVAVQHARTISEQRRIRDRLRAVVQVTQGILQGQEIEAVLHLIASLARELVGAELATVATPEPSGDALVVRAADGGRAEVVRGTRFPIEPSISGAVFRTGQAVTVGDAAREKRALQLGSVAGEFGPALFIPLAARGRPMGTIMVANRRGAIAFGEEDARLVEVFAAEAAVALEHARIRSQLERLATATAAAAQPEALAGLARHVVEATDTAACVVFLVDAEQSLRTAGTWGLPEGFAAAMEAAVRSGARPPVLDAIESRKPVIVDGSIRQMLADPLFAPAHELLANVPGETIMSLPFVHRGLVVGAISCFYPSGHRPSETDVAFLKVVADQAASAAENARLHKLAHERVALEERQRLARELHDSVSQALYGIVLGARTARDLLAREPVRAGEPIEYVLQLAEAGLAEMRALIFELRPESLETEGLVAALTKQAAAIRARYGMAVEASLEVEPVVPLEVKQALNRIAQEALHNTAKHARATRVDLSLRESAGQFELEIADNGIGFDASQTFPGHLGLRSMRERAVSLGGHLEVSSVPGQGTRIRVTVPLSTLPAGVGRSRAGNGARRPG